MTDSTAPRRGHLRTVGWTKVSHGLFRPRTDDDVGDPRIGVQGWRADLPAWQLVLPTSGAFTHLTGCEVYGWWMPPVPADLPIFACMNLNESRPRRSGLVVSRHVTERRPVVRSGLPVDRAVEVLLRCARDLGVLDMVVLVDSALRNGDCSLEELGTACAENRAGVPTLRRAVALADPRSESPWESVLRVFHVLCEVPVEPQFEVFDDAGRFVARGDLRISGTSVLHEYDGAVHRDRRTHRKDLSRDRRLLSAQCQRRGFTSADLMGSAHMILREADAALGRPHDPRRLKVWYAALRESLFSREGTERLRRKWKLPVGRAGDWSKTA